MCRFVVLITLVLATGYEMMGRNAQSRPALTIAHRGASGYAPEHTLAAYRLALDMKADYVEQDLQMTRDGELICSHDAELSRTTDIQRIYPGRASARDLSGSGTPREGWFAVDFTLAELKELDAGSWFNQLNKFAAKPEYAGARIPTLDEAIALVKGHAGLYIEIKHVAFYKAQGHHMVPKLVAALEAHGLMGSEDPHTPVLIQSFSKASLLELKKLNPRFRLIQLLPMEDPGRRDDSKRITQALAAEIAGYAYGAGPERSMIQSAAHLQVLHSAGLQVHPYTFRGSTTHVRKPLDQIEQDGMTVRQGIVAEIRRYLQFGVDGGFTDYPDLWRQVQQEASRK
jgi:glycerophosphoryl diester phosphodiesterase